MTFPLDYPNESELRWLFGQGVPDTAMLEPTHLRASKVRFLDGKTFDFDADGERVLIFIEERDRVAWQPRTGQLATWCGLAFALGEEAIFNPATYFAGLPLRIHRTPLDWLKADRDGIVIVQPRFAHAYLRDARMSCADRALAANLKKWIQPPAPRAEIFLEASDERRAA